jgi:RNA polymerase sigma-70 factor (ECF subfamily)
MKHLTDIELLVAFERDRNKAFEEIYDRFASLVYGVCLKYLGSRDESLDAVVGIFELLIRKIPGNQITNFSSWLYSVSKNHCLMIIRKGKRETRHIIEFYNTTEKYQQENITENEMPEFKYVQEALCLLSNEQKECVTMFYYNDMSYADIAEATGFSVKSVKSYLQNGKVKLKKIMEEQKHANSGY